MTEMTKAQVRAAFQSTLAVAEVIRELGMVPSGHLYARLMDPFSLEAYEGIINTLISAGLVRREPSHLLVWIGPPKDAPETTG